MPGAAVKVSVGHASNVWAVNSAQEIWNWNGMAWNKSDGAAVDVSVN